MYARCAHKRAAAPQAKPHTQTHTHTHTQVRTHLADVIAVEAAGGGEDDEVGEGVTDVHLPLVAPRGEEVLGLLFWCGESEDGMVMGRRCGWGEHEHNYRTPNATPRHQTPNTKHALALVIFST